MPGARAEHRPCAQSAIEIAREVRARRLSAEEVFDSITAQIERVNPLINAVVRFDPRIGREEARRADSKVRDNADLPLLGVPFTVKDNLWVGGLAVSQGSRLFEDFIAPRDAWCVARLRALGAVFVGITNCAEFACRGVTENALHGTTRNAWDPDMTPGGSSGGAASAVAAGFAPLALGTDAGGSTRRPAAHCGVVGMKPSRGLVPHPWGFENPDFGHSVIGTLARTVRDAAWMLECLAGYDAADRYSCPVHADTGFVAATTHPLRRTLKIAFSRDLGCGFAIDDDVLRAIEGGVHRLARSGFLIEEDDPRWPAGTFEYPLLVLQQAGLAALYGAAWREHPQLIDSHIGSEIERGFEASGTLLASKLHERDRLHRCMSEFFDRYDILLCPTAPVTAWPVSQSYPPVIGGRPATPRGHAAYTPLFNYCGVPACSVPCGLAANGLPVGIQVVGKRFDDATVLAVAAAIEAHNDVDFTRPCGEAAKRRQK